MVEVEKTEMDNQRFEEYRDKFFLAASIGEEAGCFPEDQHFTAEL